MKKYAIMYDRCELKVKVKAEDIIDAYLSGDMLNGSMVKEIALFDDRQTALEELKKYHCGSYVESAYVGKARICEFYLIQEREYDDDGEWEDTGCYDFAEIEI